MKRIILAFAITACGTDPAKETDKAGQADAPASEIAPADVPAAEAAPAIYSMALATKKDLPACGKANAYQLIYIKDSQTFFSCEGDWIEVAMPEAAPETVKLSNLWDDEVTGKQWLIGSATTVLQMVELEPCTHDWRRATTLEIRQAISHGMADAAELIGAEPYFWSSEVPMANFWRFVGADGLVFSDWETPGQPMKVSAVCVFKD